MGRPKGKSNNVKTVGDKPSDKIGAPEIVDFADYMDNVVAGAGGGDGEAPLELLRVDFNEDTLLRLITRKSAKADIHYAGKGTGYVVCNGVKPGGEKCNLCLGRNTFDDSRIIPVWVFGSEKVFAIRVSVSGRPGALYPILAAKLRSDNFRQLILSLGKRADGGFKLEEVGKVKDGDPSDKPIAAYIECFERGEVDLTSPIRRMTNPEMVDEIPGLAEKLDRLGFDVEALRAGSTAGEDAE